MHPRAHMSAGAVPTRHLSARVSSRAEQGSSSSEGFVPQSGIRAASSSLSTSGETYCAVPTNRGASASPSPLRRREEPKSMSLMWPSSSSRMFSGFRSRCTTPTPCMYSNAFNSSPVSQRAQLMWHLVAKVENPRVWGGLRRAPKVMASFQAADGVWTFKPAVARAETLDVPEEFAARGELGDNVQVFSVVEGEVQLHDAAYTRQ